VTDTGLQEGKRSLAPKSSPNMEGPRRPANSTAKAVGNWLDGHAETLFWAIFGGLMFIYLLPLALTRFLPFSDLPGHLGVVGALLHRHVPAAHIDRYYWLHPHFEPNSLEFTFTWLVARVTSVTTAARLFAALCVALVPLASAYTLKAFDRNPALALVTFPLSYPRIMWYGFMGSSLGVGLLILSLGLARQTTREQDLLHPVLLGLILFLTGWAHPFFLAAAVPLSAIILFFGLVETPFTWKKVAGLAALLPPFVAFAGWFHRMSTGMASPHKVPKHHPSLWHHIVSHRPPLKVYRSWIEQWSIHGYKSSHVEHETFRVLMATMAILLTLGVTMAIWRIVRSSIRRDDQGRSRPGAWFLASMARWRRWLPRSLTPLTLFGCVLTAYLTLPGIIHYPVEWWAVSQRLVTPLILVGILVLPKIEPRWLLALGLGPIVVFAGSYGIFLANDFHNYFYRREMAGLAPALRQIPPGKRVLGLYDDREDHYAHFPLHFASAYYTALRGGMSLPFPMVAGYKKIAWAYPKKVPPSPAWGKLALFSYHRYGRFYDYFLIKRHGRRKTRWRRFPKRCVIVKGEYGLWIVVERRHIPGC